MPPKNTAPQLSKDKIIILETKTGRKTKRSSCDDATLEQLDLADENRQWWAGCDIGKGESTTVQFEVSLTWDSYFRIVADTFIRTTREMAALIGFRRCHYELPLSEYKTIHRATLHAYGMNPSRLLKENGIGCFDGFRVRLQGGSFVKKR